MEDKHEKLPELKIGIAGYGFVGKAIKHLFKNAYVYDPFIKEKVPDKCSLGRLGSCDIVFICVPTDMKENGEADTSIVESLIKELTNPIIVIKSTIPPGTADFLALINDKHRIVFSPEFMTEKHWKKDVETENRIILGGDPDHCKIVAQAFQSVYYHDISYIYTTRKMAEMVKYTNNAFFALKVSFTNQISDICEDLGLNYGQLREIWLSERRIGRSHTLKSSVGGFGGYCLPKDLMALIKTAEKNGNDASFLKSIWNYNCSVRPEFKGQEIE